MPRARQLRDRIVAESREIVSDNLGNEEGEFQERLTCAAEIRAKFGGEAVTAARLTGQQPVVITVRQTEATSKISPAWRLRDARGEEIYNIRSIADPDGDGRWIELLCQTGAAT